MRIIPNTVVDPQDLRKLQRELADKISSHAPLDEIRILLASGAQVNEPVVQGLRPLHYAVYANNIETVRLLLVRGSDINALDDVGYSALHLCAEHGNYGLIEYLINHNARVSFVDPHTKEPFPTSSTAYKSEEPLRLAIKNGHYDCAELLLQNGADANAHYFLGSEINLLAQSDTQFMRLLLMYNADPNSYDRDGLTPLMKACRSREGMETVNLLLEYGANVNALALERQDFRTPLHYAILSGNTKLVSFLLGQGAHVNMPADYQKPSPLDLAVLRDNPEIVQQLLSYGANANAVYTYIGTPLHLACISDLTHQLEILELLLLHGGDPNLCPVFEEGVLKPPIVEYFRSRTEYNMGIVRLLFQFGAEMIMQSPTTNPRGMLRVLSKVQDNPPIMRLLLSAGQQYSLQAVERLNLSTRYRLMLLRLASEPMSLLHTARCAIRRSLKPMRPEKVVDLPIPASMRRYLLYDY